MTVAVAVLAVLPEYRRRFVDELFDRADSSSIDLQVFAGDAHTDSTVRSADYSRVSRVVNHHLFGRRLLWQGQGATRAAIRSDVAVVDLNPRSLTAWVVLITRRSLHRRTLAWGHVNPRLGAQARTAPLRRFMRRLASGIISYTWTDADQVRTEDPTLKVWVAANGLYTQSELGRKSGTARWRVLYVGRLEPTKRPSLLLHAFSIAAPNLPKDARLSFVGTGSELSMLEDLAQRLDIHERVDFYGQVSDYEALSEIYAHAIVSVSPGYVGLSLTQSLGFGVPMIVADDEPHAPEVELLTSATGATFTARDPRSLAKELELAMDPDRWDEHALVEAVRSTYSSTSMVDGFIAALRGEEQAQPENRMRSN